MYYLIQKLIIGAFLAFFSVQSLATPLKRDKAVECAAILFVAELYLEDKREREDDEVVAAERSPTFHHFISQASALDTSKNPTEAAQKAVSDAYKKMRLIKLSDSTFVEKFELCSNVFIQHMQGIQRSWKEIEDSLKK